MCLSYGIVGFLPPRQILLLGTILGTMHGSFGSQIGPQSATNVARNVPWTFRPSFYGATKRNLSGICGT